MSDSNSGGVKKVDTDDKTNSPNGQAMTDANKADSSPDDLGTSEEVARQVRVVDPLMTEPELCVIWPNICNKAPLDLTKRLLVLQLKTHKKRHTSSDKT